MTKDCREGKKYNCPYRDECKYSYGVLDILLEPTSTRELKKFFEHIVKDHSVLWGVVVPKLEIYACKPGDIEESIAHCWGDKRDIGALLRG